MSNQNNELGCFNVFSSHLVLDTHPELRYFIEYLTFRLGDLDRNHGNTEYL